MGSGDGELGCYAIIGIQPCVPVSSCVCRGNDVTEQNESHMESLSEQDVRERKRAMYVFL